MRKKLIICALLLGLLAVPVFSGLFGQTTEVQSAVQYLETQPDDPWITMALISAGESNLDLNYLKTVSGSLATDYEKTILALTAAGKDPRTFGNIDFVAKLKGFEQSNQIGSPTLLNDDFWGIIALVSAGESPSDLIIQNSKNFILTNQNLDGGWSYAVDGNSDTNDTAIAIASLLDAGASATSTEIIKAIDYLKSRQNTDGGFSYSTGSESDSGSDTWVISTIYKLGQNPSDWQNGGNDPIAHLKSLQRADGSFKWIATEDKGYPVLTAYAVIALMEDYYPVNKLHHLRIEGKDNQICDANVAAKTALDIIENGATVCGYTYAIEASSWGPYLKKINNDSSTGTIGWLYFVDYQLPMVGAGDYILAAGDEVLWYLGEWGWKPTRITLDKESIEPAGSVKAKVEYFEGSWNPLAGAQVYVNSQPFVVTNSNGEADIVINDAGVYNIFANASNYIRTNSTRVLVGQGGISQNVDLTVEIVSATVPEIAFSLSKSQVDFGRLALGGQSTDEIVVQNNGNTQIIVEGIVSGDSIFKDNLKIDNQNWPDFSAVILSSSNKNVPIGLAIPSGWTSLGVKEGSLTFWAISNQ